MLAAIKTYRDKQTKAAPLAVFRILFGILMLISIIRFWYLGWIEKLYILPKFHFHYLGFDWITVPGQWTYLLFFICGASALLFAIGYKYKLAIVTFFLSFTYIELMDKTTYLNHYYLVSLLAFILIWLPAQAHFSVDSFRDSKLRSEYVPKWNIDVLKLMISIVYLCAGIAKINRDWMMDAMPLSIWLRGKVDLPIIGQFMDEQWVHYIFSWGGAFYDLFIVFFLLWRKTRIVAFIAVLVFHLLTKILFPIGMFPYIMIVATLLFFDSGFHQKILTFLSKVISVPYHHFCNGVNFKNGKGSLLYHFSPVVLSVFFFFQILLPFRCYLYPGNLFWTEQGYRFSWRVMLMEKTAYANFKVVDGKSGKRFYVQNEDFLTDFQQKQMATQADFIVEYAHYLGDHFEKQGHENLEIYVESFASLNGRKSQVYLNPEIDLLTIKNGLENRTYIMPFNEN